MPTGRGPLLLALLVFCSVFSFSPRSSAYPFDTVTATVVSIDNTGVGFDPCCNDSTPPDFYAEVSFIDADGVERKCGRSPTDWQMEQSSPNFACTLIVRKPYQLIVRVFDDDGGIDPLTGVNNRRQADLDLRGPMKDFVSPLIPGATDVRMPAIPFLITGEAKVLVLVDAVPTVPVISNLKVDPAAFDSTLRGATISGDRSLGVELIIWVDNREIGRVPASNKPTTESFSFSWDGSSGVGLFPSPLIPGTYEVAVIDTERRGQSVKQSVTIRREESTNLMLLSARFVHGVLQNAPFEIVFSAGAAGTVTMRTIAQPPGATCHPGAAGPTLTAQTRNVRRGRNTWQWDGKDASGAFPDVGEYCLILEGVTAARQPFLPTYVLARVEPHVPLFPVVHLEPFVPAFAPGAPVTIVATARSPTFEMNAIAPRSLRPARQITISAGPYSAGPYSAGPSPAPTVIGDCFNVDTCRVALPAHLAAVGTLAYSAEVISWTESRSTPIMLADLRPPSLPDPKVIRIGVNAEAATDGSRTIREVPRSRTIDLVYYAGTGYWLGEETGRLAFGRRLLKEYETMLGIANRRSSSVYVFLNAINFLVSTSPATITSPGKALCESSITNPASFADINAVLHAGGSCRDWSGADMYTAGDVDISWHEFHHQAYGLADEYCPDTIHFQGIRFPNVYNSEVECRLRGSAGSICKRIADPPGCGGPNCRCTTSYWRADPETRDVMLGNSIERSDDLRAAIGKFDDCRADRC